MCFVSNEHGGFIYDPIGSNILEYTTTTTTNTVERLNSKRKSSLKFLICFTCRSLLQIP